MQLCNRDDIFGNSVYFRNGYSQCPFGFYLPTASTFQELMGYEPSIQENGVKITEGLYIPLNSPTDQQGMYLCNGIYNTVAVDTWVLVFYDGVSKKSYCQGPALLPIRCYGY